MLTTNPDDGQYVRVQPVVGIFVAQDDRGQEGAAKREVATIRKKSEWDLRAHSPF